MGRRASLVVMIFVLFVHQRSLSFRTRAELNKQYKDVENKELSVSEHLAGKAMAFVYSNQTVMNLVARELWNAGSRVIDKIVHFKDDVPAKK